jgi:FkbM family methyltransferase
MARFPGTLARALAAQAARLEKMVCYLEHPRLRELHRRGVGLELYRKLAQPWLMARGFNTVLDVGANIGHFALAAAYAYPQARLYAFEPLPDCFARLNNTLAGLPNCHGLNIGLGPAAGVFAFEQNQFPAASSFLKLAETHKREFPQARETRSVSVNIEVLDAVAKRLALVPPILIKIDVQGYEDQVLRGGAQTLGQADTVLIETSFEPLYQGQPLFADIFRHLTGLGLEYHGSLDQIQSAQDGRALQADSLFVRPNGPA